MAGRELETGRWYRQSLEPLDSGGFKQRLAAILVADVAGYTRLLAMDERATVTALDQARAVIRARG